MRIPETERAELNGSTRRHELTEKHGEDVFFVILRVPVSWC